MLLHNDPEKHYSPELLQQVLSVHGDFLVTFAPTLENIDVENTAHVRRAVSRKCDQYQRAITKIPKALSRELEKQEASQEKIDDETVWILYELISGIEYDIHRMVEKAEAGDVPRDFIEGDDLKLELAEICESWPPEEFEDENDAHEARGKIAAEILTEDINVFLSSWLEDNVRGVQESRESRWDEAADYILELKAREEKNSRSTLLKIGSGLGVFASGALVGWVLSSRRSGGR